jgi:hypothetical protein
MEIQALKMATHFGATNRLADLDARERAMLGDTNAPEELRYEVRMDLLGRELQARAAAGADMNAELEKAGRALVKEFPSGPEGYEILMELSVNADLLKMHEFGELMANSGGPPELTDMGKGLQRRIDAIGKPLRIEFKAADGRAVDLDHAVQQGGAGGFLGDVVSGLRGAVADGQETLRPVSHEWL